MVNSKNWDRALLAAHAAGNRIRHRHVRCRSRILKTFAKMEKRT